MSNFVNKSYSNIIFSKYHACGNDFIIIDEDEIAIINEEDKSRLAKELCEYHLSIGANGILYVNRIKDQYTFRIFEPDGSESDMCGNGIRCVAAYYFDKYGLEEIEIRTKNNRVLSIARTNKDYKVKMGSLLPVNEYLNNKTNIPRADYLNIIDLLNNNEDIHEILSRYPQINQVHMVNIGEPHLVIFANNISEINIEKIGEIAKDRKIFPAGININLVEIICNSLIKVRTYERGNWNETLSCGTGSCCSAAMTKKIYFPKSNRVNVLTKGGNLEIEFNGANIFLNGEAKRVFKGAQYG